MVHNPTHDLAEREHDRHLQQTPDGDQLAKVGARLLDEKVVEHGEEPREEGEEAADVEVQLGHRPRVPVHAGLSLVERNVGGSVRIVWYNWNKQSCQYVPSHAYVIRSQTVTYSQIRLM